VGCLRTVGGMVVGAIVLLGFGRCALGLVPLTNRGSMPADRVVQVVVLSLVVAGLCGWFYMRSARKSWRVGVFAWPFIAIAAVVLLAVSALPMQRACQTYHTQTVCPAWAR
jgi:hypothetical protein